MNREVRKQVQEKVENVRDDWKEKLRVAAKTEDKQLLDEAIKGWLSATSNADAQKVQD